MTGRDRAEGQGGPQIGVLADASGVGAAPHPSFSSVDEGLSFRQGESVCAPMTTAPDVSAENAPPTAKAHMAEPLREK
eukprot:scaffold4845_cov98-Isochrysis_galbana.AAC.6